MQRNSSIREHKVSVLLIIFTLLVLFIQGYTTGGISQFKNVAIPGIIVIAISIINYLLPINNNIKGLFFGLIPGVTITVLFMFTHYSLNKHYILVSSVAVVALYFNKKILLIHGAILDVLMILAYILNPTNITGSSKSSLSDFISSLVMLNATILVLYFLCKWGRDLIDKAKQNEINTKNLLDELQTTFRDVEASTQILDNSITQLSSNMKNLNEASHNITLSMQEMAKAIQEEATGAYNVNETMINSKEIVSETLDISTGVIDKTSQMHQSLEEGWIKIGQMNNQMSIISSSISTANQTAIELQSSMDKINAYLNGIKDIADQTNLLALNASIESARAGEQGKGFAVVAGEIGKLAEQSARLVQDISILTTGLSDQSKETYDKVSMGEVATSEGLALINNISTYFKELKDNYEATNLDISKVMNKIESVSSMFTDAQLQVQNMASISEENAAATEEVLATTENENKEIQDIGASIRVIQDLSQKLKQLISREDN